MQFHVDRIFYHDRCERVDHQDVELQGRSHRGEESRAQVRESSQDEEEAAAREAVQVKRQRAGLAEDEKLDEATGAGTECVTEKAGGASYQAGPAYGEEAVFVRGRQGSGGRTVIDADLSSLAITNFTNSNKALLNLFRGAVSFLSTRSP